MRKFLFFLGTIIVVSIVAAGYYVPLFWLRVPLPDAPRIDLKIPPGATLKTVADILTEKQLVKSASSYRFYAVFDVAAEKPKTGKFTLQKGLSYQQIARILTLGPSREERAITIIEGWTTHDVQQVLTDIEVDARASDFLPERFWDEFDWLHELPPKSTLEGYLFPDSYRVWKDQLPDGLLRKQLAEFREKTMGYEAEAKATGRILHEVVTLASIIEKEVQRDEDRAIVAGIFMNRLKTGMPLQSDATLNYVIKSGRTRLTLKELENESSYNTYKHKGLPPGPISNPGLASLEAALRPAKTDYWFFLTDKDGKTYFAKTLEQHAANRYKAFGR